MSRITIIKRSTTCTQTRTGWYRLYTVTENGHYIYHKDLRREVDGRRLRMRVELKGSIDPKYWDKIN